MTDAVANPGNGLQQPFPFMKLPAGLHLVVYEVAMRSHLEDIDLKFLQCGPPGIGEWKHNTGNQDSQSGGARAQKESKAAPYLGALAILHAKMVHWESYNAMDDVARRHWTARNDTLWKIWHYMNQARRNGDRQREKLHHDEITEMHTALPFVAMVEESLDNTFPRYLKIFESILEHGNLHGKANRSALSIKQTSGFARSAAGICRDAALMDAVRYFPGICDQIQQRLESGAGERTSFISEVEDRVKWKITDEDVAITIDGIVALGHSLETIRGPDSSNRL
ncbi:hypothetical protein MBLNU13_g01849t1 [Cladosporium sp. NU13]